MKTLFTLAALMVVFICAGQCPCEKDSEFKFYKKEYNAKTKKDYLSKTEYFDLCPLEGANHRILGYIPHYYKAGIATCKEYPYIVMENFQLQGGQWILKTEKELWILFINEENINDLVVNRHDLNTLERIDTWYFYNPIK